MKKEIKNVNTEQELEDIFPIIKQLRENLNFDSFKSLYVKAKRENRYCICGLYLESVPVAAVGYRVLHDFCHGEHLYIDDLVTDYNYRSNGYGAELLRYLEVYAQKQELPIIRLSSGLDKEEAHRFYKRNNWPIRSYVFKKSI